MIIKRINNNSFMINDINIIKDIYDKEEIKNLISIIIKKLKKKYKLNNLFIFTFYIDEYNNNIIKIINKESYTKYIDIKIKFYINNIILYKIDYFLIDKLNINNKNIYYYKDNFYLEIKENLNIKQKLFLEENTTYYYKEEALNIIDKGLRIKI